MNIVITGASRGIGLELTKQALARRDDVLVVARDPRELSGQVKVVETDVTAVDATEQILRAAKDWDHVDVLINNAGIMTEGETMDDFLTSFQINSVAPFLITKALLPLLKKSKSPKVVNITSLMGSIADNGSGGYYAYRASKAALNMINKSLADDFRWLTTVVVHPGWVKTAMGGPNALVETLESASGIWTVIDGLTLDQSGHFYDYLGKELPW